MWAVGCILGELLIGQPLFPGTSTMNQLDRILEITGRPSAEDIEAINSPFAATMLDSIQSSPPKNMKDIFPKASDEAIDLLRKLLKFNPKKRLTAEQALEHPFVAKFHDAQNEPSCPPIKILVSDNEKKSVSEYRDLLYAEIIKRKKEVRNKMANDVE